MAETRASKSKGKKLDSIISKLKIHTPLEAIDAQNEPSKPKKDDQKTIANSENVGVVEERRSKRKSHVIVRYRIDGDEDDIDKNNAKPSDVTNDETEENIEEISENDVQLPETIFDELPNGEAATFEEGEDTTVLFLPSEEIQVRAGPPDEYLEDLLDGGGNSHHEEEMGEEMGDEMGEEMVKEKKKKKKKSKTYESDESLDEDGLPRRVICTACGRKVNPSHGTILRHPTLNVLVCKKCNQYYNSGPFTRDEYGIEEQCRWCGDGGDLICCDVCEKVFCKPCLQRNCGKTYLKNLLNAPEDFKWLCIVCNKDKPTKHIQRLRKKCEMVMEALDHVKAQKAHFKSKKGQQLSSVVIGPTTSERRSRLNCLSEGIKGEGFSSSGESPTKRTFGKDGELPAELFSKIEDEHEKETEKEKVEENKSEPESESKQEDGPMDEQEQDVEGEDSGDDAGVKSLKNRTKDKDNLDVVNGRESEEGDQDEVEKEEEKMEDNVNEESAEKEKEEDEDQDEVEKEEEKMEDNVNEESAEKEEDEDQDEVEKEEEKMEDNVNEESAEKEEDEDQDEVEKEEEKMEDNVNEESAEKEEDEDQDEVEKEEEKMEDNVNEESAEKEEDEDQDEVEKEEEKMEDTVNEESAEKEKEEVGDEIAEQSEKCKTRSQINKEKHSKTTEEKEDKGETCTNGNSLSEEESDGTASKQSELERPKIAEDKKLNEVEKQSKDQVTDEDDSIEEIRVTRSGRAIGKVRARETETPQQSDENSVENSDKTSDKLETVSDKVKQENASDEQDSPDCTSGKDQVTDEDDSTEEIRVTRSGRAIGKVRARKTENPQQSEEDENSIKNSDKTSDNLETVSDKVKQENASDEQDSPDCTSGKDQVTDEDDSTEEIRVTRSGRAIGKVRARETENPQQSDENSVENSDKTSDNLETVSDKVKQENASDEQDSPDCTSGKDQVTDEDDSTEEIRVTRSGRAIGKVRARETENPQQSDENSVENSDKTSDNVETVSDKVKQENASDEQDSPDCTSGKRLSRKSKDKANKLMQKKEDKKQKKTTSESKSIVIISDSSDSSNKTRNKVQDKEEGKKKTEKPKGKQKHNTHKEIQTLSEKRKKASIGVKNEREESNSSDSSDSKTKKVKRITRSNQPTKSKAGSKKVLKDEDSNDNSDSIDSEDNLSSLKTKRKENTRRKRLEESSDSDFQTEKTSKKNNLNKKRQKLENSSESDSDSEDFVNSRDSKMEGNDYSLEESSESDEKSSDSEQESESDNKPKSRRSRGLQKQTRKRPRPVTSSSSNSEESSKESSDDEEVARRTRKKKQIESDSSDVGTIKTKKTTNRQKKTRKKGKGKKGMKRKHVLDSEEEDESGLNEDDASESELERKSKSRKSNKKKKNRKGKKPASKKKRRRVMKNSDTDSDSDSAEEKSPNKGRRKIRKLLTDEKLGKETQKARRLEEERRKRLLERTKIAEDDEMPKESWHINAIVLEKDKETKESLVEVQADLVQHLKPHQAKGIQFMYDNVVDSMEGYKKGDKGGGCILAHCMGLGKTLQVVALLHTLHNHKDFEFKTTLIIAPLNTVLNWQVEFDKWLSVDERMEVYVLKEAGHDNWRRADMLKQWQRYGGILIMGYDMYRNLSLCHRTRSKFQKKIFKESLVDPGPDLVVCDEGHILRNDQSAISKTINSIKTRRRIVLTGTPLQNNLIEYHCMVSFVKPNLLGTRKEFMNLFGNPILNGQCVDSIPLDVQTMKQSCHVLFKLLEGCVQRRDYSVLTPFLPPKHEYVIKIRLSEKQRKLYDHYLKTFVYSGEDGVMSGRGGSLFSDYQALMRIWTHPWCLKLEAIRRSLRAPYSDSEGSLDGFVVHTDEESESVSSPDEMSVESDESLPKRRAKNTSNGPEVFELMSSSDEVESNHNNTSDEEVMPQPSQRLTRSRNPVKVDDSVEEVDNDDEGDAKPSGSNTRSGAVFKEDAPEEKEWYDEFLAPEDEYNAELSGKLALLLEIIADAEAVEEKVLVFSQSLVTLDLIERALGGGEVGGDRENWCRGCDYFRMDGSTTVQLRQRWADIFNDVDNKTARLFLISTKAGGLGINLVAANRVIVFDVSWNPSHDVQSIFRVYRFGQTKPVYVYRLVIEGAMEERIYDRQIAKLSTAQRVIDKHQIVRHFTAADLSELYTFNPSTYDEEKDKDNTPKLPLPKDAVLADIINRMHPKWIVKYHEHDSLLQNVTEEELTEDECKQAWAAYEAQKNQSKNDSNMRALQAQYAQQQLQQQRQAIPSQNMHYNNAVLREMQQLQRQQLSERMARMQADLQLQQQQRFSQGGPTTEQQERNEQLRHQLLQHLGAVRPVYQARGPGPASYQPMMSYLSQQQQQAHHLLQPQMPPAAAQIPPNQPRPTAAGPIIRHGTQYRM